jgi:hypothetical protein
MRNVNIKIEKWGSMQTIPPSTSSHCASTPSFFLSPSPAALKDSRIFRKTRSKEAGRNRSLQAMVLNRITLFFYPRLITCVSARSSSRLSSYSCVAKKGLQVRWPQLSFRASQVNWAVRNGGTRDRITG